MKKLQVLAVVVVMLIAANASAQTKIGYIRMDDIVGLMPEIKAINMDTVGQKYLNDSVLPRYRYLDEELRRKQTDFNDTTKPASVRAEILKSMQEDRNELDGFEQVVQQVQQYRQQLLLRPYYEKVKKAIDDVAKQKGYTHVLNTEVFLVAPEADDLSLAVLAKLNIKLPNQPGQNKPATPAGTKPAGTKPAGN